MKQYIDDHIHTLYLGNKTILNYGFTDYPIGCFWEQRDKDGIIEEGNNLIPKELISILKEKFNIELFLPD